MQANIAAETGPAYRIEPAADRRASFRREFCRLLRRDFGHNAECDKWLVRTADEPVADGATVAVAPVPRARTQVVIVNGIFGGCLPGLQAFRDAVKPLEDDGYRVSYIPVQGRASSEHNARVIRDQLMGIGAKVIVIGYSKGVTDTLTALANYPELGESVAAVVGVAGVVNGTPVADLLSDLYKKTFGQLPDPGCRVIDGGEVQSLTRDYRTQWLRTHALPTKPLYFSIAGTPAESRVSPLFAGTYAYLSRWEKRNDGQVMYSDAMIPHSALMAYANADHFAIALDLTALAATGILHNDFPRAQLIEAAVHVVEQELSTSN